MRRRRSVFTLLVGMLGSLLLGACSSQPQAVEITRVVTETLGEEAEFAEEDVMVAATGEPSLNDSSAGETHNGVGERRTTANSGSPQQRLIIKTGSMELLVANTATAVDEISNLAAATGGYIVEQRVWESSGFKYATLTIGVPVAEFERSMTTLRRLGEVQVDAAEGEDVTDEYVDLESRLGNLLATQERLRSFLEEATKVEEVLKINDELTKVEEELEIIQGRMNYLTDRATFSTIRVTLNPIVPTPTPSPTVTPTPVPQWLPVQTARDASATLQSNVQETADFVIWYSIACGPWLLLLAFLGVGGWRVAQRLGPSWLTARVPDRVVVGRERPLANEEEQLA